MREMTVAEIVEHARSAGLATNAGRVRYLLDSRGIKPTRSIAHIKLFSESDAQRALDLLLLQQQYRRGLGTKRQVA